MTKSSELPVDPSIGVAQVLAPLLELMQVSDSDSARIAAAKILLERMAPKTDDEARQREAEEREAALADARGLLAELAAASFAGVRQPGAVVADGAAGTTDAADSSGTDPQPSIPGPGSYP